MAKDKLTRSDSKSVEEFLSKSSNKSARSTSVSEFLSKSGQLAATTPSNSSGRLLFAMDATASREHAWDMACQIQADMFMTTQAIGALEISLCYYRGYGEFHAFDWTTQAAKLRDQMLQVHCLAGQTQIKRTLEHALRNCSQQKIKAVVFVGDCFEESTDDVATVAGKLGMLGVPVFVFHEGHDTAARTAFKHIAQLSNGAYCPFDQNSVAQLKELLCAVAAYAVGGIIRITKAKPARQCPGRPHRQAITREQIMARIIFIIAAIVIALFLYRWIRRQPANKRWQIVTIVVVVVLLGLVLTGRLHWLFAFIGAMIPFVQRMLGLIVYLPMVQRLFRSLGGNKPSAGQNSQVDTDYLHMELDHDSGNLSGSVKAGTHAGRDLHDLSLRELLDLYEEYARIDEDSRLLLGNYLDRKHGSEWRAQTASDTGSGDANSGISGSLSEQEAYSILGLEAGADRDQIIAAHKRLMQKLHPDRGGSSYLATKINQAKDLLLQKFS